MAASSPLPVLCPVMIGRVSQLETLIRLIEQTHDVSGQTAGITGKAGIGKSRLVSEVKTGLCRLALISCKAVALKPDRVLPYVSLLDLLRIFCANKTDAEIIATFGDSAPELRKVLGD